MLGVDLESHDALVPPLRLYREAGANLDSRRAGSLPDKDGPSVLDHPLEPGLTEVDEGFPIT